MLWSNGALNWKDELKKYPLLVDQTDTIKKFKDNYLGGISVVKAWD